MVAAPVEWSLVTIVVPFVERFHFTQSSLADMMRLIAVGQNYEEKNNEDAVPVSHISDFNARLLAR